MQATLIAKAQPGGKFRNIERKCIYNSKLRVLHNPIISQVNKIVDSILLSSLLKKD